MMAIKPMPWTLMRELTREMVDAQWRLQAAHATARGCATSAGCWSDETQASYRDCCNAFAMVFEAIGMTLAASYPSANDEEPL